MASSSCGRLWRRRVPTLDRQSCSAEQVPCQHQAPSRKRGREASQLRRSCRRSSTAAHANVYLQQRRQARGFGARAPWPHLQACKQRLLLANMPGRPWAPKSFRCPAQPASQAQTDDLADDSADESLSQQRNTVRMRQLPGGRILNGRPGAGFVTLRSGKRISCPRCEGSGWVGTGAKAQACEVCSRGSAVELLDLKLDDEQEEEADHYHSNGSRRFTNESRRKASATSGGKQKRCSLCGELGHNKARCPRNPDAKVQEVLEAPKAQEPDLQQQDTPRKARFRGVSWSKRAGKWRAQIWNPTAGTVQQLGYFSDELDAARAYDRTMLELRGPLAVTNFPPSDYDFDDSTWTDTHEEEDEEPARPSRMTVPSVFPLPRDIATAQKLAVAAIQNAHAAGIRRQAVEYFLPGGSEGWPGGVRQQYAIAQPLLEGTIRDVKRLPSLQGRMSAEWLDEMERIGMWRNEAMAAVVFPSAETLAALRRLDAQQLRLLLICNPQWQTAGQLVSDFGFGRAARDAEAFLRSFEEVYVMRQLRIDGDNVVLFKCYPGRWQVHYQWQNGEGDLLVARREEKPNYGDLLTILRDVPGSRVSRSSTNWVDRVRPFLFGVGPGDAVLLPQEPVNLPAREADAELFEREPQTGDVWKTLQPSQDARGTEDNPGDLNEEPQQATAPSTSPQAAGQQQASASGAGRSGGPQHALASKAGEASRRSQAESTANSPSSADAPNDLQKGRPPRAKRRGFGRFDQFDIVTGLPVRDVRMEPLAALASWQTRARNLFGSTDSEAQRGMHEDQAADDDAQSAAG